MSVCPGSTGGGGIRPNVYFVGGRKRGEESTSVTKNLVRLFFLNIIRFSTPENKVVELNVLIASKFEM